MGLEKYLNLFQSEVRGWHAPSWDNFARCLERTRRACVQEIDFVTLTSMTDADLKSIGLTLFGPRRKIVNAVARWKQGQAILTEVTDELQALQVSPS